MQNCYTEIIIMYSNMQLIHDTNENNLLTQYVNM